MNYINCEIHCEERVPSCGSGLLLVVVLYSKREQLIVVKGDVMKLQSKIYLYNFLTVVFALLTVVSLGSLGNMALYTVFVNVALFGFLAHSCYNKENQLRRILKNRRRRKMVQLSVYRGGASKPKVQVA